MRLICKCAVPIAIIDIALGWVACPLIKHINVISAVECMMLTAGKGLGFPEAPNTANDRMKIMTCAPPSKAPPKR